MFTNVAVDEKILSNNANYNTRQTNSIEEIAVAQLQQFNRAYDVSPEILQSTTPVAELKPVETDEESLFEFEIENPSLVAEVEESVVVEEKVIENTNAKLDLQSKLLLFAFASIILLLGILLVYNAVLINNYNISIASQTTTIEQSMESSQIYKQQLDEITQSLDFSADGAGLSKAEAIKIDSIEKVEKITYENQTNWFDAICNFIASIFGG